MVCDLKNRKVLVTGAGDGIGRALALAFAQQGAHVCVSARSEDRLQHLLEEMEGDGHLMVPADLSTAKGTQKLHDQVQAGFQGLDVLVNNVGSIGKLATFFELSDQDWIDSFEINLLSAVRMCRLFIPLLKNSGAPRIINISSIAAASPGDVFPHYSAQKAALSNLTVSLSTTLADDAILVNTVSPGPVWSRSWEKEAETTANEQGKDVTVVAEEIKTGTASTVPLKRMGVPEDVTGLVLFLASDQASWITGSNFTIDGGIVRNPF